MVKMQLFIIFFFIVFFFFTAYFLFILFFHALPRLLRRQRALVLQQRHRDRDADEEEAHSRHKISQFHHAHVLESDAPGKRERVAQRLPDPIAGWAEAHVLGL